MKTVVRAFALFAAAACSGTIEEAPEQARSGAPGDGAQGAKPSPVSGATAGAPAGTEGLAAGTRPLRRMTRLEYDNTVRDLLGDTTKPANTFPEDLVGGGGFAAATNVSPIEVERYSEAAARLATGAVANLAKLLPCDPAAAGEAACASQFIAKFGRRAYRRPLLMAEKTDLQALYTRMRGELGFDFKTSVGYVIRAMLQSPRFLYHWEQAEQAPNVVRGLVRLGPYEVASRLSYFLWSTMPDDDLFAAAEANALSTPERIEAQALRMLTDPRAGDSVRTLFAQLFDYENVGNVSKDPRAFPKFNAALAAAMAAESDAFVKSVVLDGDGRLETLLTAPYSFLNAALAAVYGVAGITGTELRRVPLDPQQRGGILTQGAFLAAHALPGGTSPVQRGKVIRLLLLCQAVPPPPPNAEQTLPMMAANSSTRAQYEVHATDPACKACHGLMDPIGFGLENYDGIGAYRTMDGKVSVDASGSLTNIAGGDKPFNGPISLSQTLARTNEMHHCMATQMQRWLTGRADEDGDRASIAGALQAFEASGLSLRELMVAVARSPGFANRLPLATEVLQ